MYASRRKAELVSPDTFSILQYDEYVYHLLPMSKLMHQG